MSLTKITRKVIKHKHCSAKHCTNIVRLDDVCLVYCLFCKQPFVLPHSNTAIDASTPSQIHTTTRKATPPSCEGCGLKNQHPTKRRVYPTHSHPSPFLRDVGGSFSPLDGGIGEGEPQEGTHDVGGPPGVSQTKTTTNVVVSFLPFLLH
jgi:hypothetical protein